MTEDKKAVGTGVAGADTRYVPKKEVTIYAVAALGQGLIYSCMSSYITDFYMNVLSLNAIFVILLMLLARVWDAVNDPLMGMIVDRHTTRWGRLKPYPVFTALPVAVLTVLMFTKPFGFDLGQKTVGLYVYVAAVYVLWGMIYTAGDVPFWSMPNLMTPNPDERSRIVSYGRTVGGVGSAVTVALPIILGWVLAEKANADELKYVIMAVSMAAIGTPLYILSSFAVKERLHVPNSKKKESGDQSPSTLKRVFGCKPLTLVVIAGVLSFGRYMMQAAAPHVARYAGMYVGMTEAEAASATLAQLNKNVSNVQMIIQICTALGMFGSMLVLPKLYKRFEYKTLMISSCLAGFGASVLTLVIGWWTKNLFLCIPFFVIMSIPLGVINVVSGIMIFDCLDYLEWETGFRDNGLGAACQSFVNKLGNAFATVAIIVMYVVAHLDVASMNSGGESALLAAKNLTTGQHFAMYCLVTIVPGISLLLTALPLFKYDFIGEKKKKIVAELEQRREARGIKITT